MNHPPPNKPKLITIPLPFPGGSQVDFDLPADFIEPIKKTIKQIIHAYEGLKSQAPEPITEHHFAARVKALEQRVYKLLPEVDDDERFNLLYLYMTFWLSLKMEKAPQDTHSKKKSAPGAENNAQFNHAHQEIPNPDEFQQSLKSYIAHALAWVLTHEIYPGKDTPRYGHPQGGLKPVSRSDTYKLKIPNAFPKGIAVIPNNPVVATGLRAIFKGGPNARKLLGGWSQIGEQVLYRQLHRSGRGEIRYYPQISPSHTSQTVPVDTLWEFVESLNPFTADVALAILAQLCEPSAGIKPKFPLRQSVLINANAILRYKGIQKYGQDRRIMEKRIHEEVERLRNLHFDMERYPMPWNKKGTKYIGDRLFDIVRVDTYQLKLFGKEEIIEMAWSVRAGQWAEHFFNTEQERVWTSRMAKALIEMDHRKQRKTAQLAKKIGYLLLTVPGGTAHRNRPVTRRIDRIFEEIGELPAPEFRTKDWAGRLRDNLMKAWDILLNAGVIKELEFRDGFGFEDTDRTKGWVENWLASKVTLTTPEAVPEPTTQELEDFRRQHLKNKKGRKRRISKKVRKNPQPIQLRVCSAQYRKKIRDACEEHYISQRTLAKSLGIAASTLSNILRGHDLPSLRLAEKINHWLEESGET